ncbi:MAG TPA: MupA/Atu3671 family FMN-dependent luciferase-like monooxygenase [Ilumatobacteraceae bacterium]|nr:MupA/Atu3671 family FMN-dependent luciferase-like monooxygenase [Ilumatobacteraceae bacterium]
MSSLPEQAISLTPTQQGMLFHQTSSPGTGVDIEQVICSLFERLDVEAFLTAWRVVVEANPALRARFEWDDDDPRQVFATDADLPVDVQDWSTFDTDEQGDRWDELLREQRAVGFDLGRAPSMRLTLVRRGERRWDVVWTFHHILCDGRSFPLVLDQVFEAYEAACRGQAWRAADRPHFADHVRHVAHLDLDEARSFWTARLLGFGGPTPLPGGSMARPAKGRGHLDRELGDDLTASLFSVAETLGVTVNTLVQGAWAVLLSRSSGENDVVFGATRSGRGSSVADADRIVGCLINTLPVRARLDPDVKVAEWLRALRASELEARDFEHTPLMELQTWARVPAGRALFDSLIIFDHQSLDGQMKALGADHHTRQFHLIEQTNYPLTLYVYAERPTATIKLAFDEPRFDVSAARRLVDAFVTVLEQFVNDPEVELRALNVLGDDERQKLLHTWNATRSTYRDDLCIHQAIEEIVHRIPDAVALVHRDAEISYDDLNQRANRLAYHLLGLGVSPGTPVGLCAERCPDLVVALLAIHKAGGCYVPLDPTYPRDRLEYMLQDSGAPVLVTQSHLQGLFPGHRSAVVLLDEADRWADRPNWNPTSATRPHDLAYVIYTSGSTGRPKGVMVEHVNVLNFFTGMDQSVGCEPADDGQPGTWLAVTSLSFDISVLELLWTLARGFRVVLHEEQQRVAARSTRSRPNDRRGVEFSLMFFSSAETAGTEKYRLLLESARFADSNGFSAIWTPERHFHEFGGLYPNPSVVNAALSQVTRHVALRSGSVVMPLHHPVRVAEEWALVDNLSNGRVGISFASGWQPRDFVLAPGHLATARETMLTGIDQVRRLWRGEAVSFAGPNGEHHHVRTSPRPVQAELPIWLTAAGSPETFQTAGTLGAGVLTHLLGQSIDELVGKVAMYREAWRAAGHPGDGHVTLMLHTFVGDNTAAVKETVRDPMMSYLGSSLGLVKGFASSWTAFKRRSDGSSDVDVDLESLTEDELHGLLEYSFERYFETSGLFGDVEHVLDIVDDLKGFGVDEIACLIDFGVDEDRILAGLSQLGQVRELAQPLSEPDDLGDDGSIAAQIHRYGVTHLQCTPSLASMLLQDPDAKSALGRLRSMLVGGEALPKALASELRSTGLGRLLNMYGPTETTIWSAVYEVGDDDESVPIGRPIANTTLYVLDDELRPVPVGVPGELCIGGSGVVRGYLHRSDLTAERFVRDPFSAGNGRRLYRTGDLARWRDDGVMEFLGRLDHQVKIRGHRIELGEIEAALNDHAEVREAVVIAREDVPGDLRLAGYLVAADPAHPPDSKTLRAHLRTRLPEAMVPSTFVVIDAFPQTPNMKIDRKALPAPSRVGEADADRDAQRGGMPSTAMERLVADIWMQLLHVPEVGLDENFFDLGGHSLLAVKTQRRLVEAIGRPIRITDLFRFPTVRTLAEHLANGDTGSSRPESAARGVSRRDALAARRSSRSGIRPPSPQGGSST